MDNHSKKIGVYLHTPFCESKCPYCDFYSSCNLKQIDQYADALIRSFESYRGRAVADTLYFGGGTPTLLGTNNIERIIKSVKDIFRLTDDAEITCEANPNLTDREFYKKLKATGINRLSLGVQSAVDNELLSLGRKHTMSDVSTAFDNARAAGFDNISLDVMLGIPNQTDQSLEKTLEFLLRLQPEHISAYLLKIEPNTVFAKHTPALPDEDMCAHFYEKAVEAFMKSGYRHYETSNFCKPSYQSRHNLKYWKCEEYLGFGPSAHSFFEGKRFYYDRSTKNFILGASPIEDGDGGDFFEYAMLALRLDEGLVFKDVCERYDMEIPREIINKTRRLSSLGLVYVDEQHISLTTKGQLLSNRVILELLD